MEKTLIIWFRKDLRLQDNDAVYWAAEQGYHILPFFHYAPQEEPWGEGEASQWWLHHALEDFRAQVSALGGKLILGDPALTAEEALLCAVQKEKVSTVVWNQSYEPHQVEKEVQLKSALQQAGVRVKTFHSGVLFPPDQTFNQAGTPFKVFTPFWKALQQKSPVPSPHVKEASLLWAAPQEGASLQSLKLLPEIAWDAEFSSLWKPTRQGALERIAAFLPEKALRYPNDRDRPDLEGTSRLSPYLCWGQIGPRELLEQLRAHPSPVIEEGITRQLFWREFSQYLLFHFPHTPTRPFHKQYENFPWKEDETLLKAWQRGATGYPIIDAAMRELWHTGWMHNRARMIVASFLVKHLLQPWQAGAAWFWDTLVDADLANNTFGWQWVGGCGADGAPYFRIFNPITQGRKFDPSGDYVKKWCPELKNLPTAYLHAPWEAPPLELLAAGVSLGENYPFPLIDHTEGRKNALDALAQWKHLQGENA